MSDIEKKMYKAMQDSRWWPVGDEAIEDMTKKAMEVASEYIEGINNILLSGLDDKAKVDSIKIMHEKLTA